MRGMGNLEAEVMDVVWSVPGFVTVREVLERLTREPPLAYTTVMTVMDNLHRKGLLQRHKEGRAYVYDASRTRGEHTAQLMNELLDVSGDRSGTLLRFVEQMSVEEQGTLKRLLRRRPPAQ